MARIYRIVAAKPGEVPKDMQEALNLSAMRNDRVIMVPTGAVLLSVVGGQIELAAQGGVK
jgi:hypothetical protein